MINDILHAKSLRKEKERLETFLAAMPFEYCAIDNDGQFIASPFLEKLLYTDTEIADDESSILIKNMGDVLNGLQSADAAALDGYFTKLQQDKQSFHMTAKAPDTGKTLRINGKAGAHLDLDKEYFVLWFDDISDTAATTEKQNKMLADMEADNTRFQLALDTIPNPLWMTAEDDHIIWCNRPYANVLNMTQAAIIAEQKSLPFKPVKNAEQDGDVVSLIQDGKRFYYTIENKEIALLNAKLHIAVDITREQDLISTHKRYGASYQELLEQLATAIAIFRVDQRLEFYNSSFAQLWHLEDSYLNTHPKLGDLMEKLREMRRLPEQADFRSYKQGWIDMFTGLLDPVDDMMYLPDGTALRMLVVPHPMGGLMMTFEDVSSRLELESSYNTLIAVQQETLDNLTEGVAAFGGDGRLKLSNPAFGNLWGLNPEDLSGEPHITRLVEKMKGRIPPSDWDEARENLVSQCLTRQRQEGRIQCRDKTLIEYGTVPLPDGGMLVSHIDITDSTRVEQALREKNAALETAEKLKTDFLANVSYQLRTPLNAIMGFAEILDNQYFGELNDKQREYSGGIQDAGNRLMNLINDILDLATIEAGYMELNQEKVSLNTVLQSVTGLAKDWARKDKIEFTANLPDDDLTVFVDKLRIKQIVMNLVSNAITFTPEGGEITLDAKQKGKNVIISVTDTGSGVSLADQERIFMPFERGTPDIRQDRPAESKVAKQREGVGLGLSLVKNIIELHGGHITLESSEGQGTTVMLIFPAEAKAKTESKSTSKSTSKPKRTKTENSKTKAAKALAAPSEESTPSSS